MTPEEMECYERMRWQSVRDAVTAADDLLIKGCHGNPEVLMLLTSEVAAAFAEKLNIMLRNEVYKKELLCEVPPEAFKHLYNKPEG
jgi:hypothetical protein